MRKNGYFTGRMARLLCMALAVMALAPAAARAQLSETKIVAPDGMDGDFFGEAIAIDGNRVVVGVRTADINNVVNPGAAYVYERLDGQWQFVQKLTAKSIGTRHFFGESVALDGTHLLIGEMGNDDRIAQGGAVHAFEYIDGQWQHIQVIYPDDLQEFHGFGWEIALQGDRAFIGAPQDEDIRIQAGAVYLFEWDDLQEEWVQKQKLLPENAINDVVSFFGTAMGLDGDHLIVSSPTDHEVAPLAGAAYLFTLNRGLWEQTDKLLPPPVPLPDSLEGDTFSREVALNGDWAFVGSSDDERCINEPLFDPQFPNSCTSGAVFAYQRRDDGTGDWDFKQKIAPDELEQFDFFGFLAIASEDNRLVVGARGDDDACPDPPPPNPLFCDPGAAYLFELIDGEWQKVGKYTASDADSLDILGGAFFGQGRPIGLSGSHVAVGAPTIGFGGNPKPNLGAAYIFKIFNQDPVAVDDEATTDAGAPVEVFVLANDSDPDADHLTLSIASDPANGSVDFSIEGNTLVYTPNAGFGGTDTFSYQIDDGDGGTAEATVTVSVSVSSNAPSAPVIISPEDGATVAVGGSAQSPLPADTPFEVTWTQSTDPNGDAVTYAWEISDINDFSTVIVRVNTGTQTRYEATLGVIDDFLRRQGVALGASLTLFHRAVASDGTNSTPGATATVRFIRAVLTSTATEDEATVPEEVALYANYPNPFNPSTQLRFALPQTAAVRLAVFDVLGREVAVLVNERLPAGWHEAVFEATDLPSGVYLYQLEAGGRTLARTMLLMK